VQPFTDKQISLCGDFAALATIALESTRRERQYREMQSELAHANRLATLGQLSASIVHEVKQPIGAVSANAQAALRFLDRGPAELGEVRQALADIVKDYRRAGDVIGRISDLIKKALPRKDCLEINGTIGDVIHPWGSGEERRLGADQSRAGLAAHRR
jgi:C4-dicarboxylate-specific signal transduction histidine kinase